MKQKKWDYNTQIPPGLTVSFSSQLKKTYCYILGIPWDSKKKLFSYGESVSNKKGRDTRPGNSPTPTTSTPSRAAPHLPQCPKGAGFRMGHGEDGGRHTDRSLLIQYTQASSYRNTGSGIQRFQNKQAHTREHSQASTSLSFLIDSPKSWAWRSRQCPMASAVSHADGAIPSATRKRCSQRLHHQPQTAQGCHVQSQVTVGDTLATGVRFQKLFPGLFPVSEIDGLQSNRWF